MAHGCRQFGRLFVFAALSLTFFSAAWSQPPPEPRKSGRRPFERRGRFRRRRQFRQDHRRVHRLGGRQGHAVRHREDGPRVAHLLDHAKERRPDPNGDQTHSLAAVQARGRVPGPRTRRRNTTSRSSTTSSSRRTTDRSSGRRRSNWRATRKRSRSPARSTRRSARRQDCRMPQDYPFVAHFRPAAVAPSAVPTAPAAAAMDWNRLATQLGLAFLGGLILNLMPCVLPVISLKVAVLPGAGGRKPRPNFRVERLVQRRDHVGLYGAGGAGGRARSRPGASNLRCPGSRWQ